MSDFAGMFGGSSSSSSGNAQQNDQFSSMFDTDDVGADPNNNPYGFFGGGAGQWGGLARDASDRLAKSSRK